MEEHKKVMDRTKQTLWTTIYGRKFCKRPVGTPTITCEDEKINN
jgi:hypothetical protein